MKRIVIPLVCLLSACGQDETISAFVQPDATYHLIEMGGDPFPSDATIRFPDTGQILGQGPCNTYSATQNAPYPWIEIGPVAATKRACPALFLEARYFEALGQMTAAEALGDTLILTNDLGERLVFEIR